MNKITASLSQPNSTRSFVLLTIGAVIGLGIAGFGLFTAKGTQVRSVPPENVATVNQQPILMTDFIAQAEAEFGPPFSATTMEQRQKVLNDMIREELYVQRGMEIGMAATDADTRAALVTAVEQQVVAGITTQAPTDAELTTYYDAHSDRYSTEGMMTVTDLLAPSAAAAASAVAALRGGQAASAVAARLGLTDTKKTDGEEFYFAARLHLGEAVFAAAKVLASGKVSDPVTAPDGVHVLVMTKNLTPVRLPFAEARDKVLTDYKMEAQDKRQKQDEAYLRDKSDILVAKAYRTKADSK